MGFGDATGFGGGDPDDEDENDSPDDDEHGRPSSLPDPLDRIWLHPSELSPLAAATVTRTRPMWTTTLVAGAAGAILTLAVLGAIGALGKSSGNNSPRTAVPTSVPIVTAQALAVAVAHSVVAVSARAGDDTRRGSGVCVRHSGEILTSDRLIGSATKIDVTTPDGTVHPATVVGRDTTTDLVLLKLASDPAGTTTSANAFGVPAPAATSAPQPGDTVWVVGAPPSPGDTALWMSSGLVASTDSLVAVTDGPTTSGLLETAAASGLASSGGALVDRSGDVAGIVLSPIGDDRVTYAVPIATALSIADDLEARGFTQHGALGITGVNSSAGPKVTAVIAGGPAQRAGVHANDVVEAVGNHEVDSMNDLMAFVRHDQPGQQVVLELQRGAKTLHVSVSLTGMVTK